MRFQPNVLLTPVDYFPEGVRVEGEPSPASHLHVVDITSPGTLTLGENITATVSVQVATDVVGLPKLDHLNS